MRRAPARAPSMSRWPACAAPEARASEVSLGVLIAGALILDHLDRVAVDLPDDLAHDIEVAGKAVVLVEDRFAERVDQLLIGVYCVLRSLTVVAQERQCRELLLADEKGDRVRTSFIAAAAERDDRPVGSA